MHQSGGACSLHMDKTPLLIDDGRGMTKLDKADSPANWNFLELALIGTLHLCSFPRIQYKVFRQMANLIRTSRQE